MGDGLSDVLQNLVEISQDGTSYSGDLLSTMDVLRNMTEIFRRAYHSPTSGDVQVSPGAIPGAQGWLREVPMLRAPGLILILIVADTVLMKIRLFFFPT